MKIIFLISCLLLIATLTPNAQDNVLSKLTGPYLGQHPPGDTPVTFAPWFVSTG